MTNFSKSKKRKRSKDGPDPELVREVQRKLILAAVATVAVIALLLFVVPRL